MNKDKLYWIIFNRIKRKHPDWTGKQVGTFAWRKRWER